MFNSLRKENQVKLECFFSADFIADAYKLIPTRNYNELIGLREIIVQSQTAEHDGRVYHTYLRYIRIFDRSARADCRVDGPKTGESARSDLVCLSIVFQRRQPSNASCFVFDAVEARNATRNLVMRINMTASSEAKSVDVILRELSVHGTFKRR